MVELRWPWSVSDSYCVQTPSGGYPEQGAVAKLAASILVKSPPGLFK